MNNPRQGRPGEGRSDSRPRFAGRPGSDRPRGAPPEQTGAETNYLIKNMEARTPLVVRLVDNQEIRGWIEYYDRNMIKLNRKQPPHLFIRKENIKYIYKDEETTAPPQREKP